MLEPGNSEPCKHAALISPLFSEADGPVGRQFVRGVRMATMRGEAPDLPLFL